jgi:hypothetical protein
MQIHLKPQKVAAARLSGAKFACIHTDRERIVSITVWSSTSQSTAGARGPSMDGVFRAMNAVLSALAFGREEWSRGGLIALTIRRRQTSLRLQRCPRRQ